MTTPAGIHPEPPAGPHPRVPRTGFRWARLPAWVLPLILLLTLCAATPDAGAQSAGSGLPTINLNIGSPGQELPRGDTAVEILFAITLLSLAPSIVLLMTCFTRIVIVLSFIRTALTLPTAPANQVIVGLSLFLTFFIMAPVWERIDQHALKPYQARTITGEAALEEAAKPIRVFMLRQTRPKDVDLFVALARLNATPVEQLPLRVVIPSFIISELRTAFQMGFLLFIPFILIDLVVATVLMSMGMMMMPPTTLSLPLKILLFVLVDGWTLVVRSLVQSFGS
ncbi:MAG TPA: flagellar biosynthetic protein FliP [Verrucomicrobiales bacterium]|nr:flagellar biosynthetic protein FliP [Verrucomicrobiales bacterium]